MNPGALVDFHGRPGLVESSGDKLVIRVAGEEAKKVRPKDVTLIHPGPVGGLDGLELPPEGVEDAWRILTDGPASLRDLAELMFGDFTPAAAWSAWRMVREGVYFEGTPERVAARPAEAVRQTIESRNERHQRHAAWRDFIGRVSRGGWIEEDRPFLAEIEQVARVSRGACRALTELGSAQTAPNAHALLLKIGYWDASVNPYPARLGVEVGDPAQSAGELPPENRRDLTGLETFAIDDEDTTDPDDAMSVERGRLWVHVADAAALIPPDCPLDLEARGRGGTLYLPERINRMLPDEATLRLALGLAEVSPALSFSFSLDGGGAPRDVEITPSLIRARRVSYERAEPMLATGPLAELQAAAGLFRARRMARGAVPLLLPEVKVRAVNGSVTIRPLPRLQSRDLVAELMLMAGEAAARYALEHGIPLPYTTQPPPEAVDGPPPATLSQMYAWRKKFPRSVMKSAPEPHAGLGLERYAQATSPLRRYLDLVVHQQMRAHLAGRAPLTASEVLDRVGAAESVLGSLRRAERLSNRHWTLVYLTQNPDWTGRGVVVELRGRRAVVMIPELGFDALMNLPFEAAPDQEVTLARPDIDLPELAVTFTISG